MSDKKPEALKYITYKKYKNGGEVLIHPGVNTKGSDYKQLVTIANQFAKEGKTVKLTPSVHFKSDAYRQLYGTLENTPYYRKCPDLKIGNDFYEFESFVPPFKKEKISHMLSHGAKQSSRIIINNTKGASDRYILNNILSRIKDKTFNYDIDEMWLYEKGKTRLLYKKTVGS
jgi:cobalamin biosynthesis Co2+ chelatase CbiK